MAPLVVLTATFTTNVATIVTTAGTTNDTITGNVATNFISSTTFSVTYASPLYDACHVVDHCLALTTIKQQDCDVGDYACQCITYQAIVTGFENCPGDPRQQTYTGMIAQYCALAGLPTNNTALAPSTSATSTRPRAKGTSTSDEYVSSPTANLGAKLSKGAGGIVAAVVGALGAVL